ERNFRIKKTTVTISRYGQGKFLEKDTVHFEVSLGLKIMKLVKEYSILNNRSAVEAEQIIPTAKTMQMELLNRDENEQCSLMAA
ncbi:hypothetical protein X798_01913, partial [Onchocerca flexuosa]|uniref:Transposase n=2 Tax=Onchocerca flexuosa TaxID=387005 RepID=A0A183HEA2_9BILA